jgi:mono/diheme cytochrome c family protein
VTVVHRSCGHTRRKGLPPLEKGRDGEGISLGIRPLPDRFAVDVPLSGRAIAFGSERAATDSLPLKRGGMGRGSNSANDHLPVASRPTSPFQGEVSRASGEAICDSPAPPGRDKATLSRSAFAGALLSCCLLLLADCGVSMTEQRKYKTYAPANLWADGSSARPLPAGTVAQGDVEREAAAITPPPATPALLERGRERYGIFCAPCHGLAGDGDGVIVAHGFPKPPSYHIDRLLAAPSRHFYDVISKGYGVMFSYADRVDARDRWAITAYIRALQLSRRVAVAQVPEAKDMLK